MAEMDAVEQPPRALTPSEAEEQGWDCSGYASINRCNSCPICEALVTLMSGQENSCPACKWQPGQWPSTAVERHALQSIVILRLGADSRRYSAHDVGAVRRLVMLGSLKSERPVNLPLDVDERVLDRLTTIAENGFYGATIEQAACELIREGVRRVVKDGLL